MDQPIERAQPAAWFRFMRSFQDAAGKDLLGGPRPWKLAHVVNFQKGGTLFFVLGLMALYDVWTAAAWTYLAMHGSYGLIWLLKDRAFPDASWEVRITIPAGVMAFLLVLGPYWAFPWLLISGLAGPPERASWLIAVSVGVYAIGVVLMMAADAQKHFVLQARRGLITNGLFARVRHPNYLGEMMVYGAFALLVWHWIPWLVLLWVWGALFATNIAFKEASMARYPEWAAYKKRSGLILPKLFGG